MRSRYIAYMLGDGGYLYRTQHPDYRPVDFPKPVAGAGADAPMAWRRLEILDVQDGEDDSAAEVEFKAWYRQGSGLAVLH
jgi:SEC-C motif-containing protein